MGVIWTTDTLLITTGWQHQFPVKTGLTCWDSTCAIDLIEVLLPELKGLHVSSVVLVMCNGMQCLSYLEDIMHSLLGVGGEVPKHRGLHCCLTAVQGSLKPLIGKKHDPTADGRRQKEQVLTLEMSLNWRETRARESYMEGDKRMERGREERAEEE